MCGLRYKRGGCKTPGIRDRRTVVRKILTTSAFSRYTNDVPFTYLEPMHEPLAAPRCEYGPGVGPATPDAAVGPLYADALYWSRRGEVACLMHAPERDSQRWPQEQWAPMPTHAMRRHGIEYQCQHCSASGRPIARHRLSSDSR